MNMSAIGTSTRIASTSPSAMGSAKPRRRLLIGAISAAGPVFSSVIRVVAMGLPQRPKIWFHSAMMGLAGST
jgi:hypothetical protein